MRSVELTRVSPSRVDVVVRDGNGENPRRHSSRLATGRHFRDASKDTGIPSEEFQRAIDRLGPDAGDTYSFQYESTAEAVSHTPFTVYLRGLREPVSAAATFTDPDPLEAVRSALAVTDYPASEPLFHWEGTDRLCAVDLDFHGIPYDRRPTPSTLEAIVAQVEPVPRVCWVTHGRGIRLLYAARPQDGYTANELAAVGALWLVSRCPSGSVELKTVTRHPGYARGEQVCTSPVWSVGDCDLASVRGWLGQRTVDSAEVAEWLESRGLGFNQRYPHDRCPVRPEEHGGRDPVTVHTDGIYCYRCAGAGVLHGSRKPGWFPFSRLCGRAVDSLLSVCIRNFTHWEHAKHIVEEVTGMTGGVAFSAYQAALKVLHGAEDERVPLAMSRGWDVMRLTSGWARPDGTPYKKAEHILATLPAAMRRTCEGYTASMEMVCRLSQLGDLTALGYPELSAVWGSRIYTYRLPSANPTQIPVVLYPGPLARETYSGFRPRYLLPANRVPMGTAWSRLEAVFPGLNREYLLLLLAARGCVEGAGGLPPFIFACGPTGASKTATIHLAAAIAGDQVTEVTWAASQDRLRQGMHEAKSTGTFCVFNEFLKDSDRGNKQAGSDNITAMDFVLNITPDSVSHSLYVGQIRLGTPPLCVWTDTDIPDYVRNSAQVARRIVGVRLTTEVNWNDTLQASGIFRPANVRLRGGPDLLAACDTILSHVIDEYFREPPNFTAIARSLGFGLLRDSEGAQLTLTVIRDFFRAVCDAPDPEPKEAGALERRLGGKGWVPIPTTGETELRSLWLELRTSGSSESMLLQERDLANVLGLPGPIACEIRTHGQRTFVRFVRRTSRNKYSVNKELRPLEQVTVVQADAGEPEPINPELLECLQGIPDLS